MITVCSCGQICPPVVCCQFIAMTGASHLYRMSWQSIGRMGSQCLFTPTVDKLLKGHMFWNVLKLDHIPSKNTVPRIYGCCFTVILHKDIFKVSLGFLQPLQEKQMQGRKRWRCRQRRAWWCDDGHQKGWARWRWRRWCTSRAVMQSGGCGHQRHEVQAGEALLHIS